MKKDVRIIVGVILIIIVFVFGIIYLVDLDRMSKNEPVLFSTWGRNYEVHNINTSLDLVLSLEDNISDNSAWCGVFNLIWNDLKNNLAKQDIKFTENLDVVDNLNKGTFTIKNLSEGSYYKICDKPTPELKAKIEKEIKSKFNETGDILNSFEWNDTNYYDYILYAMLKKEFEFPEKFIEFENETFENYSNVKYFGIDGNTEKKIRDKINKQVEVLYYNSENSFAVKLVTKTNDEVIIAKGNKSKTFAEMYENILERTEEYSGPKEIMEKEDLKIPNISFNLNEEIQEIEKKEFEFANGMKYEIAKAIQTIEFELDSKGGKIKSEAGMYAANVSGQEMLEKPRQFIVDDSFVIFLVEKDKELPYFAAKITDISKVQMGVTKLEDSIEKDNKIIIESGVWHENSDKVYVEITNEAEELENILYKLRFTKETCDGLNDYIITLDNGEIYGVEVYEDICHITAGERGEAILTKEQSEYIIKLIEKYKKI